MSLVSLREASARLRANPAPIAMHLDGTYVAPDWQERPLAPNEATYRIWSTRRHGTAAEVNDKWHRGELGPEDDPWFEFYGPAYPPVEPPPWYKARRKELGLADE